MKSGAIEFLTKPFRQQDLLGAVHRSLTRVRILRERERELEELEFAVKDSAFASVR